MSTEARAVDPSQIFDSAHWAAQGEELAGQLYASVVAVGGPRLARRFGLAFDVDALYVERFISERAHDLAGKVTQTTYDAIRSQLTEGVAAGESIPQLADRVRHVFGVATETRATLIARTEVISAYNGSANLVATEVGAEVIGGKEWIATRDARTRDTHAEADGQVVAIGQPFLVGGVGMDYPDEPNCRCTIAFLTPQEMASRARQHGGVRVVGLQEVSKLAVRVALGQTELRAALEALAA